MSGRDKVQDPGARSQGSGLSRELRTEGHRIPRGGAEGPELHAPNLRSPGVLASQSGRCAELGRQRAVARSGPGVLWVFVRSGFLRRGAAPGRPASPTLSARVLLGTQRVVGGGPLEPCSSPYVTDSEFPDPGPASCGPGSAGQGGP